MISEKGGKFHLNIRNKSYDEIFSKRYEGKRNYEIFKRLNGFNIKYIIINVFYANDKDGN